MRVGFIGLGHMGSAIAANLLRAGHQVTVWNRSEGPARTLASQGARVVARPAETAGGDALMSMLADDAAIRWMLLDQGVLEKAAQGLVHVNLATVSVQLAHELTELHCKRGIGYVAAPVFGRPEVAREGKLNTVVAGDPAAVNRIEPLLAATSQRVWRVGSEPARANAIKLAGNFMIASAIETMGEAVALTQGYGIEAAEFLDIMSSTLFAAPVYQIYGRLIAQQRYEPAAFKFTLGLKDVRLALAAGEAVHVPMPFASVLRDQFLDGIARGAADKDWAALAQVSLMRAGLDRGQSQAS
jgi:3-hydroxyisobutyrate dehydrogenase-like beta-hydroxyacid dehydrogenase